ncbi:unnamed protein product [Pseudo-nitzschia multistriata]|uniref:Uncharacterized protein n=1 Tax=Pseudo-nitzschia multistriata TaxID=183589 RepID=A0A448ZIW7_9STRA|nr:unnamed protein product [Pseudo-nitzschia multistriata]
MEAPEMNTFDMGALFVTACASCCVRNKKGSNAREARTTERTARTGQKVPQPSRACNSPKVDGEGSGIGGGDRRNDPEVGPRQGGASGRPAENGGPGDPAQHADLLCHLLDLFFLPVLHLVLQGPAELVGLGQDVGNVAVHEGQVSGLDHPGPPGKESRVDHQDGRHRQRDDLRTLEGRVVDRGARHAPGGDRSGKAPELRGLPPSDLGRFRGGFGGVLAEVPVASGSRPGNARPEGRCGNRLALREVQLRRCARTRRDGSRGIENAPGREAEASGGRKGGKHAAGRVVAFVCAALLFRLVWFGLVWFGLDWIGLDRVGSVHFLRCIYCDSNRRRCYV